MFESGNKSLEIPFAFDQRQLSIGDTDYQIKVLDTQALSRQKKKAAGQVCSSRKFRSSNVFYVVRCRLAVWPVLGGV